MIALVVLVLYAIGWSACYRLGLRFVSHHGVRAVSRDDRIFCGFMACFCPFTFLGLALCFGADASVRGRRGRR